MMASIKLLIADDHKLFRQGLVSLFGARSDFEVIGEAVDGKDAVTKAAQLKPDVILLDVRMPVMNGIEALGNIIAGNPDAKVIILTASDDSELIVTALRDGARGYLLKTSEPDDIFRKVQAVMKGRLALDDTIMRKLRDSAA
jgi:DNA-binding NarL/FixJ family response regulator